MLLNFKIFRKFFKNDVAAFISIIAFIFSVFRLCLLYDHYRWGSFIAFGFAPMILYGFYEIFYDDNKCEWWYFVLGATFIFNAHIISAVLFFIFFVLLFFMSVKKINKLRILTFIKSTFLIVLINLGFIVPFLHYYITNSVNTNYTNWYFTFNFDEYTPNLLGSIKSFAIDYQYIGLILIISILVCVIFNKHKNSNINVEKMGMYNENTIDKNLFDYIIKCIFVSFILYFMSTNLMPLKYLKFLYPFYQKLQFQERFLAVAYVVFTVCVGYLIESATEVLVLRIKCNKIIKLILCFVITSLFIITALPHINSKWHISEKKTFVPSQMNTMEHLPIGADNSLEVCDGQIIYDEQKLIMHINKRELNNITFDYIKLVDDEVKITLPLYYFPGYVAKINDVKHQIKDGINKQVTVSLKEGKGTVKVYFERFWFWNLAFMISLISIFVLIYQIYNEKIKNVLLKLKRGMKVAIKNKFNIH